MAKASASEPDRKSTRLNSSHQIISYAVFCLKKKKENINTGIEWKTKSTAEKIIIRFLRVVMCVSDILFPDTSAIGFILVFFFNDTATTEIYTLSLHDALPI